MRSDGHFIAPSPRSRPVLELKAMHGRHHLSTVNLDVDIVVVDFPTTIEIRRLALDRISMGSSTASNKIRDATMFVAFVVVYVPSENRCELASHSDAPRGS